MLLQCINYHLQDTMNAALAYLPLPPPPSPPPLSNCHMETNGWELAMVKLAKLANKLAWNWI